MEITCEHLLLVQKIARMIFRKFNWGYQLDDLMQIGVIGLLDAASKFDPTTGIPFLSYASIRIRGAMLDEIRRTPGFVRRTNTLLAHIPIDDAPEQIHEDTPEAHAIRLQDAERVTAALMVLPDKERRVICAKYYDHKKNVEIAREWGCSDSWIELLHRRAIDSMRNTLEAAA